MSSDTITLELDKYESGVVFHSLKDKRNQTALLIIVLHGFCVLAFPSPTVLRFSQ